MYRTLALALIVVLCACDAKANSSEERSTNNGQQSREYESCASTRQCASGLRCADDICRLEANSILGDYHAAAGALAMAAGDIEDAITAYGEAVNQYKAANNLDVPVALFCAQGHALTTKRKTPEYANLAARVLHRCVLGMPAGSNMRSLALSDLARLAEVGLDPLLLAQEPGDSYMTKKAKAPARDSLKVKVTSAVSTKSRSHDNLVTKLGSPELLQALLPCWDAFAAAGGEGAMAVAVTFKHRFHQGVYESQDGYKLSMEDGPAPAGAANVAANGCARTALAPMVKEFRGGSGRWDGVITIALGE
jgi:hypothetical protein